MQAGKQENEDSTEDEDEDDEASDGSDEDNSEDNDDEDNNDDKKNQKNNSDPKQSTNKMAALLAKAAAKIWKRGKRHENKDIEQLSREQLAQKFNEALKTEDTEQVAQAMAEMAAGIEEEILQRAKDVAAVEQLDAQAMAARGLRQLTSEEKKYYEAVIGAMKSENPKQALASLDVTMPKTVLKTYTTA